MTRWFSRRHPRYIRSLVYMLQVSEYSISDFFKWHERVKDFRRVEKRKSLVFTPKAIALYVGGWLLFGAACIGAILAILYVTPPWSYILFALILIEAPLIIMAGLAGILLLVRLVQIPAEIFSVAKVRRYLLSHPAKRIAIAGSYGKTSMREILKTVLAEGKKVAAPPQSYNTPLGIAQFVRGLKGDEEILIFELGEYYPGDIKTLCELVQPHMGVITGINEAHLEKFKTLERTANTIFELADYLGDKPLYVNGENPAARERTLAEHTIFTREGAGNWSVEHPQTSLEGTVFGLVHDGSKFVATSQLLGLHMIGSLAAAADIASRLGLSSKQIRKGIAKTKPFSHRLEPKVDAAGVVTLDDSYNGNPDGVAAVIVFLASLKGHRRLYVTPGLVEMGSRKEAVHRSIGAQLAKSGIEKVVLIRNSVTPYIEQGLKESEYQGEIIWFDDALEAYAALPHMTVKGDVVLLQNDWPDQYA